MEAEQIERQARGTAWVRPTRRAGHEAEAEPATIGSRRLYRQGQRHTVRPGRNAAVVAEQRLRVPRSKDDDDARSGLPGYKAGSAVKGLGRATRAEIGAMRFERL